MTNQISPLRVRGINEELAGFSSLRGTLPVATANAELQGFISLRGTPAGEPVSVRQLSEARSALWGANANAYAALGAVEL